MAATSLAHPDRSVPLTSEERTKRKRVAAMYVGELKVARFPPGTAEPAEPPLTKTPPLVLACEMPAATEHHGEAESDPRPEMGSPRTSSGGPPPRGDHAEGIDMDPELPRVIRTGAPVDRWQRSGDGITRWRPFVDQLRVLPLPDGGLQLDGNAMGRPLRLDAGLRAHLAWLALPDSWRAALENAGILG